MCRLCGVVGVEGVGEATLLHHSASARLSVQIPALLTMMSRPPKAAETSDIKVFTEVSSETSAAKGFTRPSGIPSDAAACSADACSRSTRATRALFSAKALTVASPMLRAPPVTRATLLLKS